MKDQFVKTSNYVAFEAGINKALARGAMESTNVLVYGPPGTGKTENIDHVTVPGALEIPLTLQTMAQSDRFDALIALGAVIRGETYHFEVVSNDSCRAVMEVQLDTGIPIANGILTCENDDQALARTQVKGADCAQAAVEMANLLRAIAERPA